MSDTFQINNGDVIVSSTNGRPILISDSLKLSQDVKEFFTVNVLPNGWGAGVEQLVGIVEVSHSVFVSMADKQISDGLDTFISLQNSEPRIPRLPQERILAITNLNVDSDSTDQTKFYFRANIVTEAGVPVPIIQLIIGHS